MSNDKKETFEETAGIQNELMTFCATGQDTESKLLFRAAVELITLRLALEQTQEYALNTIPSLTIDSDRWKKVESIISAETMSGGTQRFVFNMLHPIPDTDIMRGSVSEHFRHAVDSYQIR